MSFFVYWDAGSCNDGSHAYGLEEFGTKEEARECITRKQAYYGHNLNDVRLIEGEEIELI